MNTPAHPSWPRLLALCALAACQLNSQSTGSVTGSGDAGPESDAAASGVNHGEPHAGTGAGNDASAAGSGMAAGASAGQMGTGTAGLSGGGGSNTVAGSTGGTAASGSAGAGHAAGASARGGSGGRQSAGRSGAGAAGVAGKPAAGSGGHAGARAGSGGGSGSAAGSGGSGDARCGTRGGIQCRDNEFCNFEPDRSCGASDRGGKCQPIPPSCTDAETPVCGCDNHSYRNPCFAHIAGVSVKAQGLCEGSGGKTCGGIASLECNDGEFCNYEESAGGQGCDGTISDAAGACQPTPNNCTRDYRPVCGCDRRTYSNPCTAHNAAASILHDGACTERDCADLGGKVRYGMGSAAVCNRNELTWTNVTGDNGQQPIEGAVCCLKR